MNCFVTPRRPAGSSTQSPTVILPADIDSARSGLLLEVALQAEHMIPLRQHPRIHRSMRFVAGRASLTYRFVFEDEWPSLRDVAFAACLLFR